MPEKQNKTSKVSPLAGHPCPNGAGWSNNILKLYEEKQFLGEGGKGSVHLLQNKSTGRLFAVKRVIGLGPNLRSVFQADNKTISLTKGSATNDFRREFMAELQTWIDLPEHPNLVTCRSFMASDEVLIFADYIDGGSLQKWIDSGQLYAGGEKEALKRILDVAIQFAWGLRCLHELGIVHQDVKPGNVMLSQEAAGTESGILVKIADYGVARVGSSINAGIGIASEKNNLVSGGGGFTNEYASPEQLAKKKLDWRTDLWSWGISVFQMFYGRLPNKKPGEFPEKLQRLLEQNIGDIGLCPMPDSIVTILRGCFLEDPAQRWKSMDTVIDRLKNAFSAVFGTEYPTVLTPISQPATPYAGIGVRRTRDGRAWRNPRTALLWVLQEAGRANESLGVSNVRPWSKRDGLLTADIAVFDEARLILEGLVQGGRKDLEKELAVLCVETGFVLETADDHYTALDRYEKAAEIYERLANTGGLNDFLPELANVYQYWGHSLSVLGFIHGAINYCTKAVDIYSRLVNAEKYNEFSNALAVSYFYLAEARVDSDDKLKLYDAAIEIHERLVYVEKHREMAAYLAKDYINKAGALIASPCNKSGENHHAFNLLEKAVALLDRLVVVENRREFSPELATALFHQAQVQHALSNPDKALPFSDKAITIFDRLVGLEGRSEFSGCLAMANIEKARELWAMREHDSAQLLLDKAIEELERLVIIEGRSQFSLNLADSYCYKGVTNKKQFSEKFNKAIAILEYLVCVENRSEYSGDLAIAYGGKARMAYEHEDLSSALKLWGKAIAILERLVIAEGRIRFSCNLAVYYYYKAEAVDGGQALGLYDKAVAVMERLINSRDYDHLAYKLKKIRDARSLFLRGGQDKKRRKDLWL